MKKSKFILFFVLCLSLSVLALFPFAPKSTCYAEASGSLPGANLFIRDAQIVASNDKSIFVYDNLDKAIKVIDKNMTEFEGYSLIHADNVTGIYSTNNNLILLSNTLKIYNSETLTQKTLVNSINFDAFSDYKGISAIENYNGDIYVVLVPKDVNTTNLLVLFINNSTFAIERKHEITFKPDFLSSISAGLETASIIRINSETSLQMIIQSKSSFYTFTFNPQTIEEIDTWTTLTLGEGYINSLTVTLNNEIFIAAQSKNNLSFFKFTIIDDGGGITRPAAIFASSQEIGTALDISSNGNEIIVLLDGDVFVAQSYTLSYESEVLNATQTNEYKNFDGYKNEISPLTELAYFTLTSDTVCYQLPYSKTGKQLTAGTDVALYCIPSINDEDFGLSYIFAVDGKTNYFGFVDSANLSPKTATEYKHKHVYVIDDTNLYAAPSLVAGSGSQNEIIAKISMDDRVEIVSTLCDSVFDGRSYMLVKVNGKLGFILRDRISGEYLNYNLVLTNAYTKAATKVYKNADINSDVIAEIGKNARCKVLHARRYDSDFVEVLVNDSEGNELRGYVLYSDLQTDSWSMLQIVGAVLVIVNLAFLAIILITRKRLNKD